MNDALAIKPDPAATFQTPDFLMVGVQGVDGSCFIFASRELSTAELRSEVDPLELERWMLDRYQPPRTRHFVTAEMKTWVMVQAPTYGQCLDSLLRSWQPDNPEQAEPKAITR